MTKKETYKVTNAWRVTFLAEVKQKHGKYSFPDTGLSDWALLAGVQKRTWAEGNAMARYAAQGPSAELYLWTDRWCEKVDRKPSLEELWATLEDETADAVYVASLPQDGSKWTFVLTHEDLPCRYLYSESA